MRAARKRPEFGPAAAESFNQICSIRMTLLDTDPVIWRAVEAPTSITLKVLHDIIQITMGWFDQHLWEFTIDERHYGLPMGEDWGTEPRLSARTTRLRDVLKTETTVIRYVYDFGDSWEHALHVTDIRPGEAGLSYPRYIGGEWASPPEDCGGIPGYYALLDALADPAHPDHAEAADYLEGWDFKEIEELPIKFALARIANRRNAARKRIVGKAT